MQRGISGGDGFQGVLIAGEGLGHLGRRERRVGGLAGAVKQGADGERGESHKTWAWRWRGWAHALENEADGGGLSRSGVALRGVNLRLEWMV